MRRQRVPNLVICLAFIMTASLSAWCQDRLESPTTHSIVIPNRDSTLSFHVMNYSTGIAAQQQLIYYWEQYGVLHSNQGGFTGNLLHGNFQVTNEKGLLTRLGAFNHGLRHGLWTEWNSRGMISCREKWNKGVLLSQTTLRGDTTETITYKRMLPYRRDLVQGDKTHRFRYKNGHWISSKGLFRIFTRKKP